MFVEEGAKVVLVGRSETKGDATLEIIKSKGGQAVFLKTDISKSIDVKKMIDETMRTYGRIDVLVNNAAINPVGTALDTSEELWDQVININLKGTFLCSKYALRHMLDQGGGSIINVGSINSFMSFENEVAYGVSKGGVLMFTKATALDFAKKNIRVNCICPGAIRTPMLQEVFNESEDPQAVEEIMKSKHPVNRIGSPDEVAKVALFLACDDSSFITGAAIPVDGGILAGWP